MRAGILLCIGAALVAAGCADTTAIKKFAQTAPAPADMQAAADAYDQAAANAASDDVLHMLDAQQMAAIKAQRDKDTKLIVANAAAISQYMSELGAIAGLDTAVSAQANTNLKTGLSALQKAGTVTAPEVAAAEALVSFVGGVIESGVQQYTLHTVIGQENADFQKAISAELQILQVFQSTNASERLVLGQLRFITDGLKTTVDACYQAASKRGTASRFSGAGCAQAYAAYVTFPAWYAAQNARIDANVALVDKLNTAFTNIGKAHQLLYDHRDDLLTQATWNAIKPNIDQALAALAAVKKL